MAAGSEAGPFNGMTQNLANGRVQHADGADASLKPEQLGGQLVLTEADYCKLVKISPRTAQRQRLEGSGPAFVLLSGRRIGYELSAIHAWLASRRFSSTSAADSWRIAHLAANGG